MKRPQKSRSSSSTTNFFERSIPEHFPWTLSSWYTASERQPEHKEDNLIADRNRGFTTVFDEVGRIMHRGWKRLLEHRQPESSSTLGEQNDPHDPPEMLHLPVQAARERIRVEKKPVAGSSRQQTGSEDQATTVALPISCRQPGMDDDHMIPAPVGNRRLYLLREGPEASVRVSLAPPEKDFPAGIDRRETFLAQQHSSRRA